MHMARLLSALLRLLSAAGSTAVVFPARRTSLLQGGLHKVSAHFFIIIPTTIGNPHNHSSSVGGW